MELGAGQSPEVMQLLRARRDFADGFCVRDYAGHERVAVAYKKDTGVS
jgi:methylase of polypeptide subunit release factors